MKKLIFVLSVGFSAFTAMGNNADAQNSNLQDTSKVVRNFRSIVREIAALESPAKLGDYMTDAKNLNIRAIRDFHTRFTNVENTMWFLAPNGFEAYFIKDGSGNRVFYDRKGNWKYSILFYGEDKLPVDLRGVVRSVYYDMSIFQVEEIETATNLDYVVTLEDKSSIKVLRLNKEGEMEILQELSK